MTEEIHVDIKVDELMDKSSTASTGKSLSSTGKKDQASSSGMIMAEGAWYLKRNRSRR